jgi:HD-GYP domain-containing protein (c-di-GMP phosphodiesterase class II)
MAMFVEEKERLGVSPLFKAKILAIRGETAHVSELHELAEALTAALDAKSPYTKGHSDRVALLATALAEELGISPDERFSLHIAAHLHDIGKIGIPETMLEKNGPLCPEEWGVMKTHAAKGGDILKQVKSLLPLAGAVRHHHERFDGSGYPDGLSGEGIPYCARIIGLVDAYDAMTSPRPYRPGITHQAALAEIHGGSGRQFDPDLVAAFESLVTKRGSLVALLRQGNFIDEFDKN